MPSGPKPGCHLAPTFTPPLMLSQATAETGPGQIKPATVLPLPEVAGTEGLMKVHVPFTLSELSHVSKLLGGILARDQFLTCLIVGLRKAALKPVNSSKLAEIFQDTKENPSAFLDRLTKAMLQFTNMDPESTEGRQLLMFHFINQSYSDIRGKLRRLQKGPLTPQAQLLEMAFKIYHARNNKAKNHCHVITAPARPAEVTDSTARPVRAAPRPPDLVSNVVRQVTAQRGTTILIITHGAPVLGVSGRATGPWTALVHSMMRGQRAQRFPRPICWAWPWKIEVLPTCPVPIFGRDLLTKFGAFIFFAPPTHFISDLLVTQLLLLLVPQSSDTNMPFSLPASQVDPLVWDTQNPAVAKHHSPVVIQLKNPTEYITQAQYPLSSQSLRGLKPIISDLLRKGLLRPTSSPFNTPILAVKKSNGTYRLVQDLWLINSAVVLLHPVVPNPLTLLSNIPPGTSHFSVLSLKDAFFSIPLSPQSQNIFAFTWTDPDTNFSTQLTWTILPQGFQDSPHLFGQALASDLLSLSLLKSKLILYVDDIPLCSPSLETSRTDTAALLNFLSKKGYRVSPSKAQLSTTQVMYLGLTITPTQKAITLDRKRLIQSLAVPSTKEEVLSFLGVAGFLRSWIASFSLLAHPLYEAGLGSLHEPLLHPITKPFRRLQQALTHAPALHLPDLTRPFSLYVAEKEGYALGVLGHQLGPSFAPVAYLSKKMDLTTWGWAPCICALYSC
ncbi:uncharacterized protein [Alexandromys fortis]|uniref:uncharacterized protein n=1 Tax=Alexandromys fortis TaxID=100897 RepID=UPI00215304F5|nr:uncharacterized protein LOC126501502 [Microtus fortis]